MSQSKQANQAQNKDAKRKSQVKKPQQHPPAPVNLEPLTALQRATGAPQAVTRPADILTLQRTVGNQAVTRLLAARGNGQVPAQVAHRLPIQPKLRVGPVGNLYEREAGRGAAQVVEQINTPVLIQRKKLESGRLNVVGENHEESGKRRAIEKKIVVDAGAGDKYWTENEFRARPRSAWEVVFGEDENNKRAYADPLYLRIAHRIQFIKEFSSFTDIANKWQEPQAETEQDPLEEVQIEGFQMISLNDLTSENNTDVKKLLQKMLASCEESLIELIALKDEALKNEEKEKYTDNQTRLMNEFLEAQKALTSAFVEMKKQINKLDVSQAQPKALMSSINTYETQLGEATRIASSLGGQDLAGTRELRSRAMHLAATARKGDKGVWKIGEEHVEDIKKVGEPEYNLQSRSEFNEEYFKERGDQN